MKRFFYPVFYLGNNTTLFFPGKHFQLLFLLMTLLLAGPASSQYKLSWVNGFGSTQQDIPTSIDVDQNGNVYATGYFYNTINVAPLSGGFNLVTKGSQDLFVIKYDAAGNLVWAFNLGSGSVEHGQGITVDGASGYFYLTGVLRATMDMDPSSAGTFNLSPNAGSSPETFVAKYDLNGNFVCALKFGGTSGSYNSPQTISKVVNGEFIVGGHFKGTINFPGGVAYTDKGGFYGDIFLVKMDQNCNVIWANALQGDDEKKLRSVEQAGNGDLFITGYYKGTVDFDPSVGGIVSKTSLSNTKDIFIAKYNAAGNYVWVKSIGNGNTFILATDEGYGITIDKNNDIVTTGVFYGTVNFNPGGAGVNLSSPGAQSTYFAKYDNNTGVLKWAKGIIVPGGSAVRPQTIITDNNNHIYLWGEFQSGGKPSINVGSTPQPLILPVCDLALLNMEFWAEYDENGNVLCGNTMCPATANGNGSYFGDKTLRVIDTAVYVAGIYNKNTFTSDNCNAPVNISFSGNFDAYVSRFTKKITSIVTALEDSICYGESLVIKASGGDIYTWSTGETKDSIAVTPVTTTTYSVVVSDVCGCTLPDTSYFTVTVKNIAGPTISGDLSVCPGGTAVLQGNGIGSFLWSTGETTSQINVSPTATTTYSLSVIASCPSPPGSFTVTVNPPPTLIAPDVSVCSGGSVTLSVSGASTYIWSPSTGLSSSTGTSVTTSPTSSSTYTITGTDANGCTATQTLSISIVPPFTLSTSGDMVICPGKNASISATANGGNTPYVFIWQPGNLSGASININPTTTTIYSVSATDGSGCASTIQTHTVSMGTSSAITASISSASIGICPGGNTTLTGSAIGGSGVYTFLWSETSTTTSINVAPVTTTTYSLVIQDDCGSIDTAIFPLIVYDLPVVGFSYDDSTGCSPVCVNFTNNTLNSVSCTWNFGNGDATNQCNPYYCYTKSGTYSPSLEVTDINGCSSSTSGLNIIKVFPSPLAQFGFSPPDAKVTDNIQFIDLSTSSNSWQWSFGDIANSSSSLQHPKFTYMDTGIFSVQLIVSNQWDCTDTTMQLIEINEDYTLYIPNTFTPNGDDLNDTFKPFGVGIDLKEYKMYIFDRWGNLIFETDDYNKGWDGKANGGSYLAQQDVYLWKINLKDTSDHKHRYIGNVNLIR